MNHRLKSIITEVIAGLFVLLFVYTGLMKISDHNNFQGVLSQSGLIGKWSQQFAWIIPISELSIALLVFLRSTRIAGLILSTLLMILFTGYIFYMIEFMPHLPCNCGGVIKKMTWKEHLIFNIAFTLIGITGCVLLKDMRRTADIIRLKQNNFCAKNQD